MGEACRCPPLPALDFPPSFPCANPLPPSTPSLLPKASLMLKRKMFLEMLKQSFDLPVSFGKEDEPYCRVPTGHFRQNGQHFLPCCLHLRPEVMFSWNCLPGGPAADEWCALHECGFLR